MYQDNQSGVDSSIAARSVESLKTLLPVNVIVRMRATSPSSTTIATLTRLRSIGVTVVFTSTPYRPRDRYWRRSSCSERSSSERSKMRPSARPTSRSDLTTCVLVELLDAGQLDGRDGRALVDHDDQHVAVDLELHVLEESAGVQRADGLRAALRIEAVADAHRQVAEDRAGLSALHALDANVADREFLRQALTQHAATTAAATRRRAAGTRRRVDTRRFNFRFQCEGVGADQESSRIKSL